ncbi:MAG TPA: hypothetical protein VH500_04035 [Nitrososphaeraceae archaeon]|jgi:hypothetical protein
MVKVIDLIRCKTHYLEIDNGPNYYIIPASPAVGLLYVTEKKSWLRIRTDSNERKTGGSISISLS